MKKHVLLLLCCLLPTACDRTGEDQAGSKSTPSPAGVSRVRPAEDPLAPRRREQEAAVSRDPEMQSLFAKLQEQFGETDNRAHMDLARLYAERYPDAGPVWLLTIQIHPVRENAWKQFASILYAGDQENAFQMVGRMPGETARLCYLEGLAKRVKAADLERVWELLGASAPDQKDPILQVKFALLRNQAASDPEKAWTLTQERFDPPLTAAEFLPSIDQLDDGVAYPVRFLDQVPVDKLEEVVGNSLRWMTGNRECLTAIGEWLEAQPNRGDLGRVYAVLAMNYADSRDPGIARESRAILRKWQHDFPGRGGPAVPDEPEIPASIEPLLPPTGAK